MKHFVQNYKNIFLLMLFFIGCATPKKQTSNPSLNQNQIPTQAPSVIAPLSPATPPPVTIPPSTALNSKAMEKVIEELNNIELSFLSQNCDLVLEHTRLLKTMFESPDFKNFPPLVQTAIYVCDAKAGLADPERLKLAITNLRMISLRYPFINEAWLHNMFGDLYLALNDTQNALIEKKQARALLLLQQQDISSLNTEILKLDPEASAETAQANQPKKEGENQSPEAIFAAASQFINNDSPEQAIALIDTIPTNQQSDNIKRLRIEAVNNLVTNLRFKVRALFMRSTEQTGQAKKDTLIQCQQILMGIIKNYPSYEEMASIQNNLKQVQRELNRA